ncbi:MAG TPA: hypothetical protein PKE30_19555 [Niabella sp.]|nr:hypothetical protein [Niabella sp.]
MKKIVIVLAWLFFLISCSDKENAINPEVNNERIYILNNAGVSSRYFTNDAITTLNGLSEGSYASGMFLSGNDVYVTGVIFESNVPTAVYWKNGNLVQLSSAATATGIYVEGNDVYVCGVKGAAATYWKNGIATTLESNAFTSDITVKNEEVFVAGYTVNAAKYWKNGAPVQLESQNGGGASSISLSGNDIYVGGAIKNEKGFMVAVYWKNGNLVRLSNGMNNAKTNDLYINGGDLYAAGFDGSKAVYWKNGTVTALTDGNSPARINSIFVKDNDVYTAGYIYDPTGGCTSTAKYWKNKTAFTLPVININNHCVSGEAISIYAGN